jgi:hypothetical protein
MKESESENKEKRAEERGKGHTKILENCNVVQPILHLHLCHSLKHMRIVVLCRGTMGSALSFVGLLRGAHENVNLLFRCSYDVQVFRGRWRLRSR